MRGGRPRDESRCEPKLVGRTQHSGSDGKAGRCLKQRAFRVRDVRSDRSDGVVKFIVVELPKSSTYLMRRGEPDGDDDSA